MLAAAVASDLGLTLKQIAHGIAKLQPIKHRLELISRPGSFTIINDAFNSNPIGAKAALKVLKEFPKRRIIITPGMVELGEKEYELNYELGRQLTRYCDRIILVGKKHSLPLQQGVAAENYPGEQLYVAADLNDARAQLARIVAEGDVVLFENDLPDNYNE